MLVHTVPAPQGAVFGAYLRQLPAPSHLPSARHTVAPSAQPGARGAAPSTMSPHSPSAPEPFLALLQALQAPPQAALQQKPSTQF